MSVEDTETNAPPRDLAEEIRALRTEVKRLNEHKFIKVQNSMPRMLGFMLLRGLALGLGTVIGASVLVSIVVFILSQIDFIPIIGDWAANLADQIAEEVGREIPVQANEDGTLNRAGVPGEE